MEPYSSRRRHFARALDGGVAVLPAATERFRNGHTEYEFRQDSDFAYLTGFEEPDAVLIVAPRRESEREVLFLHPRDRERELWTGKRLGVQAAPERLGLDAAYALDELDVLLARYLEDAAVLYYGCGRNEAFDRRIYAALQRAARAPRTIADPAILLDEMRLFKDEYEIAAMRRACAVTAAGHRAAMAATHAGLYEYQLEASIEYEYFRNGARAVAYPSIVAGGENATVLHYSTNREVLREGSLVLVDSGCEYDLYASDVTRTWPVSGRFSPEQRAIYEIVLAAQQAGIERVKPGEPCRAFHRACVRAITEGLIEIGLLQGSLEENIERERYRAYFMHGSGHWLGLDVHDRGSIRKDEARERVFEPGMVTTVEPGIYIAPDADAPDAFKGIGVRIEDDILVTPSGSENMTAAAPKTIAEIEALAGSALCA